MEGTPSLHVVPKAPPLQREEPPKEESAAHIVLFFAMVIALGAGIVIGTAKIAPPLCDAVAAKLAAHPELSFYFH
jgi:hypothetical protein